MKKECYKSIYDMEKSLGNIYNSISNLRNYGVNLQEVITNTLINPRENKKYFTVEYLVTLNRNAEILGCNLLNKLCKPYWSQGVLDNFICKLRDGLNLEGLICENFRNDDTLEYALLEAKENISTIDSRYNAIDNVYLVNLKLDNIQKRYLGIGLSLEELEFIKNLDSDCKLLKFIEGQVKNLNFTDLKYFSELKLEDNSITIGYFSNLKLALVRSLQAVICDNLNYIKYSISIFPILNKTSAITGTIELNISFKQIDKKYILAINYAPENVTEFSYCRI